MTTFTAPLKVKLLDAETTVVDIEASGTATFAAVSAAAAQFTTLSVDHDQLKFDCVVEQSISASNPSGTALPANAAGFVRVACSAADYYLALFHRKT